ncbi:MAG: hypothetical protein ACLQAT_11645 [Candidatus Binataceae bacterium]
MPRWDQWRILEFLIEDQPITLGWFWSLLNEHRIPIPRLAILTDLYLFRGCGYFVLALIWLSQAGSALILISLSVEAIGRSREMRPWRLLAGGIVVCFLFSAAQMHNFSFPIGNLVENAFFSIFTFFCLKQFVEKATRAWIVAGALAAISSALCLASGIITMAFFAWECWMVRVPRRFLLLIVAIYGAFMIAYFHRNSGGAKIVTEALLHRRIEALEYFFVFLGNPWGPRLKTAAIMGVCGLILLLLLRFLKRSLEIQDDNRWNELEDFSAGYEILSDRFPPASLALFSIAVLIVGQALLTCFGRIYLGVEEALSSRYVTPVACFWSAELVLLLSLLLSARSSRLIVVYCVVLLVAIFHTTVQNIGIGESWANRVPAFELASNALRVGVFDSNVFRVVAPFRAPPEVVSGGRAALLKHRLSIFSDNRYTLLGRDLKEVAAETSPDACLGSFDIASGVGVLGGAKVQGWAWSKNEKSVPKLILLVDRAGIVVGLASGGIERPDVIAAIPEIDEQKTGWQGYAKEGKQVSAYAIIEGGRKACRLPGTFNIASGSSR